MYKFYFFIIMTMNEVKTKSRKSNQLIFSFWRFISAEEQRNHFPPIICPKGVK